MKKNWLNRIVGLFLVLVLLSAIYPAQILAQDESRSDSLGISTAAMGASGFAATAIANIETICSKDTFVVNTNSTDYSGLNDRWNLLLSNNLSKRLVLFEFDLSGITSETFKQICNTQLLFDVRNFTLDQSSNVRAYEMADSIWPKDVDSGSGMNGKLALENMGEEITGAVVNVGAVGQYTIDVTQYIKKKYNAGTLKINIILKVDPTTDTYGSINIYPRDTGKTYGARLVMGAEPASVPVPIPPAAATYFCTKDTFITGTNTTDYSAGGNSWNLMLSNNAIKRSAVLEFDLTAATPRSIELMSNAKLTLEARTYTLEAPTYLRAYEMADNIWPKDVDLENGLTGAIAEPYIGQAIPGAWVYVDTLGTYELDITEYIRGKYTSGARKINITLKVDPTIGATNGNINLNSRNTSPTKSAKIRVGYESNVGAPPPVPMDDMLLPTNKDTYVLFGNTTDYSGATSIVLSAPTKSMGVIEFDLTDVPNEVFSQTKTAHVLLEAKGYALVNPAYLSAYEMTDNLWPKNVDSGSGMNGIIAESAIGNAIPGARVYVGSTGNLELDVSAYIQAKYNAGTRKISIALGMETSTGSVDLVSLNQDRTRAAKLKLGFLDPPVPTVITYVNRRDTYVTDNNTTDYSTSGNMWNLLASNNMTKRGVVLEFDLSDVRQHVIDGMTETKLLFDLKSTSMTAPTVMRAYALPAGIWPNDADAGSGLTGSILAAMYEPYKNGTTLYESAILGSEVTVNGVGQYDLNITSYIRSQYEAGQRVFNIMLIPDRNPDRVYDSINLYPRNESKTKCPRLALTTTSPPPADGVYPLDIPVGLNTDDLTVTRYNDWLINLHLTTPEQIKANYQGGEGWQMVWSMAISPSNTDKLVFGTDTTGVWRSENSGYNWNPSTKYSREGNNFNAIGALSVAFDPYNESIIYAVGGSMSVDSASIKPYASGLYRSADGGDSWKQVSKFMTTRRSNADVIAFGKDTNGKKIVYVGTQQNGLLRSTDDGMTFAAVTDKNLDLSSIGVVGNVYANGSRVLVATEAQGILLSEDSGQSWTKVNTGFAEADGVLKALSVTVNPVNNKHWVAVVNTSLYETYNEGASWTKISSADSLKQNASNARMHRVLFSAVPSGETPHLYLVFNELGNPLRVSDDYGATWIKPSFDTSKGYIKANTGFFSEGIAVDPTNADNVWFSLLGEIYRSSDGGKNFSPSNSGYSGALVTTIVFNPNDAQDVMLGAIDFGMSQSMLSSELPPSQQGKYPIFNYTSVRNISDLLLSPPVTSAYFENERSTHGIVKDPANAKHVFAAVGDWYRSGILESDDGGLIWKLRTGIVNTNSWGMRMEYHKEDPSFIYAGQYYSTDNGVKWTKMSYTVHAISPYDNDIVFSRSGVKIYISRNRGKNWSAISQKFDFQEGYFFAGSQYITPDMEDPNVLWVGRWGASPVKITLNPSTNRVMDYVEYGRTQGFTSVDAAGNAFMWNVVQNPKNPDHLVTGGVNHYQMVPNPCFYESYDKGETWHEVYGMEGARDVNSMKFHPTLPQVWICTMAGIWVYEYENFTYSPPGDNGHIGRPGGDSGGSSGGDSGGSYGGGSTVTIDDEGVALAPTPILPFWYEVSHIKPLSDAARSKGELYVRTSREGPAGIRKAALLLLSGLRYDHDTMLGNVVQVRITIPNPAIATDDILLTGSISGSVVDRINALFSKWFQNKLVLISLGQQNSFGQPVNIAAKVSLSGMDTNKVLFYSYNSSTNRYSQIPSPNYWIDANGYLRFTTQLAGDIVVSEGALLRK